ncbi:MAG: T9SS type A sorting domain-containing protein, partial [Bacteroidota bacterium]
YAVDISGSSVIMAKVGAGVLHYELCESTHEVVKIKGCEPMDYYGHWLDSSGLYLNLELEAGWNCQGLTADVQFDLVEVDTSVIRDGFDLVATAENASFQWGRCGAGSDWTPVPLATDSVFSPIVAGFYAVQVQQDGCELQSNCLFWPPQLPPTSTEAPLTSRLHLYPNPGSGQATLDLTALPQPADLRIFDARGRWLGRMEQLGGSVEVDLRKFGGGPGLYVIQVQAGGEIGTLKLVWE